MKTLSNLLTELAESLGIYSNPNAFTPRGGHLETPRERQLRLKWERSPAGKAAIAMYKAMDAKALKALERKKAAGVRPLFPWNKDTAGWWHPKMQWFTFNHSEGYHVTHILKFPQRFGITDREIDAALNVYIKYQGYDISDNVFGFGKHPATPAAARKRILQEDIDLCMPLQKEVYDKGWCKVYGGHNMSIEGTKPESMKSAVREILGVVSSNEIDTGIEIATPRDGLSNNLSIKRIYGATLIKYAQ